MTRTIFITGANSGVGLACTKLFLSKGWNVVATARAPASSTDLQDLQGANEARLFLHELDLTISETFKSAIDAGVSRFNKIDVLLNNAGYGQPGMLELLSMEDYRRQFEVNVFGNYILPPQLACFDTSLQVPSPSQRHSSHTSTRQEIRPLLPW